MATTPKRKCNVAGKAGKSKYNAVKYVDFAGVVWDSHREYLRYVQLKAMQDAGMITDLRRQVEYELIPAQKEMDTVGPRGGIHKGKTIERPCTYIADFAYKTRDGETVVEDSKGYRTDDYKIKRKLMLYVHGIQIREV